MHSENEGCIVGMKNLGTFMPAEYLLLESLVIIIGQECRSMGRVPIGGEQFCMILPE